MTKNTCLRGVAAAALLIAAGARAASPAPQGGGLTISHLGQNNTMVRVPAQPAGRYLVLPVQESAEEARVNVVADGRLAETINVRLAQNKTDYTVPFDLSPYAGANVILDVVTPQDRSSVRHTKENTCWGAIALADTFDTANREKYRPAFHHTPLYGWMNDPNGMFYADGRWHLYYQWNPYGSKWQNMTWGHSWSDDLVNWHHEEAPLRPDGLGTIFSGSAVTDTANTAGYGPGAVVALYTSCASNQMQSMAHSADGGLTFEKYPLNPVITLETEARDPKVFWNEKEGRWGLILAHALDHEMLFFGSDDLKTWEPTGSFGKGLGAQGGVWECPDLMELDVEGGTPGEKRWLLICNINPDGPFGGSGTQYFVGDFDGKTFVADTDAEGRVPTLWLDYGKDHYATVTWSGAPEGRHTALGWMSNWEYAADVPTTQFRSANTLPREIGLFRGPDGEVYASSAPSPEVLALRGPLEVKAEGFAVSPKGRTFALPAANDGICEILLDIDARKARKVEAVLANALGDKLAITYDPEARTVAVDRRHSGLTEFSDAFPAVTVADTHQEPGGRLALRLFVDRGSLELFGNDGRFAMTNLVFPRQPYSTLTLSATGAQARASLKVYAIKAR